MCWHSLWQARHSHCPVAEDTRQLQSSSGTKARNIIIGLYRFLNDTGSFRVGSITPETMAFTGSVSVALI